MKGNALHSNFAINDIMDLPPTFGNLQLVWNSFETLIDDDSISFGIGLAFENTSPLALSLINNFEYFLSVEDTKILKLAFENIGLERELNSNFNMRMKVIFLSPELDPSKTIKAIESATKRFATESNFGFALSGPIKLSEAKFVENITKDFSIAGNFSDIVGLIPKSFLSTLKHPHPSQDFVDKIKGVLGDSKLNFDVLSEKIKCTFGLHLPLLDFLKPPKSIAFPYETQISIYGKDIKAIQSNMSPVLIKRESKGLSIESGFDVILINTESAARGLADAINPILAAYPKVFFLFI